MGFWKKLFGGSNQPDKDESVGVDPTTDKKMKPKQQTSSASTSEGAKFSGRTEDTKAQKQADPETREVVQEAENYPKEEQPRGDVDSSAAVGKKGSNKTAEEKRKTQPKPASKQKTTPKEAEPGTGKPKAGQHKGKDAQ